MIFYHIKYDFKNPKANIKKIHIHELSKKSAFIKLELFDNGVPFVFYKASENITTYTPKYTIVCNGRLLAENENTIAEYDSDYGNTIITIPISDVNDWDVTPGLMLIEVLLVSEATTFALPIALAVEVTGSIVNNANITEKSLGTTAEILQEVAKARGVYDSLPERLTANDSQLETLKTAQEDTAKEVKEITDGLNNGEIHTKLLEESKSMNIFVYSDGTSEIDATEPSKTGLIRVYLSAYETTIDLSLYEPYWYTTPNGEKVQAIYINNSVDKVTIIKGTEKVEMCSYVHFTEFSYQLYYNLMQEAKTSSVGNERLADGCISKTKLNSELQTNLNSLLDLLKSNCTIALDGSGKIIACSDETTISMNLIDNPNVRTVIFGESVTAFSGTFVSISFIENIYVFTEDLFYKLRGVVGSNQTLTYVESYNYIDPLLKNVGGYTLTDIDKNDIAQLVINEFDTAMVEVLGVDE